MRSAQQPIHSGFGAASTAAEVIQDIDLTGKTAIVTGGYSGIGVETVRALTHAGANVIVPTRNEAKARSALAGIGNTRIEPMDLADPASIDAFVSRVMATGQPLHMLINSAGIMATPFQRDARGYEIQFATNHLGHFQLTVGLLPALQRAQGARVVSVSSWGHRYSPVMFDDIHFERREYSPWTSYGQSKTANILFAVELDARYQADGIRAFAVHPGVIVDTGLAKYLAPEDLKNAGVLDEDGKPIIDPSRNLKNVQQGASTSVWCAASPQLDGLGGVYAENADISPLRQGEASTSNDASIRTSGANGVFPYAIDADNARRLWEVSQSMLSR